MGTPSHFSAIVTKGNNCVLPWTMKPLKNWNLLIKEKISTMVNKCFLLGLIEEKREGIQKREGIPKEKVFKNENCRVASPENVPLATLTLSSRAKNS